MFDIAWLDIWSPEDRFAERFQSYYVTKGIKVEHYIERLRCYQCYIGLDGLRFFAKTQKYDSYLWLRQRVLSLLQAR